jgi:hypothetical protein
VGSLSLRRNAPNYRRIKMQRFLLMVLTVTVSASFGFAQRARSTHATSASNDTSIAKQGRQVDLASHTALTAQLENSLDAKHAKVGDRVALKTTQAVKQNGETIIPKGARLLGHVTNVQQRTKENSESRIGVVFDRLQKGALDMPITATIVSITQAQTHATAANSSADSEMMSTSNTRAGSSAQRGGNGGLLGGVGNTVGGVVNTTASTVGSVAGTTTNAAGSTVGATANTAGNLTGSLRDLQITQSTNASADGGATLSLGTGNLKLDSGTTFHLLVSSSGTAGPPQ